MDNSIQEMGPNIFAVAENTDAIVPKKLVPPVEVQITQDFQMMLYTIGYIIGIIIGIN